MKKSRSYTSKERLAIVQYNGWLVYGWIVFPVATLLSIYSLLQQQWPACIAFGLITGSAFVALVLTGDGEQGTLGGYELGVACIRTNQRRAREGKAPLKHPWQRQQVDTYCKRSGVKAAYYLHGLGHLVPTGYVAEWRIWGRPRAKSEILPKIAGLVVGWVLFVGGTYCSVAIALQSGWRWGLVVASPGLLASAWIGYSSCKWISRKYLIR